MSERITVTLDAEARALIVDALRSDSTRRQRAATRAAAELHADREAGRKDIRSGAVMVTNLLVDAARLDEAADAIAKASTASPAAAGRDEAAGDRGDTPAVPAADEPSEPDQPGRPIGDALTETRAVLDDLGLLPEAGDDDLDFDDGATAEDDPGPVTLDAVLSDLAPQEAQP